MDELFEFDKFLEYRRLFYRALNHVEEYGLSLEARDLIKWDLKNLWRCAEALLAVYGYEEATRLIDIYEVYSILRS